MKYKSLCNCLYIDQSNITVSKKKLYTSHIGTCSILLFSYNNFNFMAHIDALQNNSKQIIDKIIDYFDISKLKNVTIFKGPWCYKNCLSTNIITYALDKLKITYSILEKKINWSSNIYIDKSIITIM